MINSQSYYKREKFAASLRQCGWTEEEITYEWYKVMSDDTEYDYYVRDSGQVLGFFSSCNYLQLKAVGK